MPSNSILRELITAFFLVGVCLALHTVSIVVLAEWLVRWRDKFELRVQKVQTTVLLIFVFTILVVLHLVEASIWAGFYNWHGLFANYETSLYFSLNTYTTIGYGDVVLPENWRLLGTIEGISGVLLCGLSTAFLFAIVNALFRFRIQQLNRLRRLRMEPTQATDEADEHVSVVLHR